MVLLYGHRRALFLMSEVPLFGSDLSPSIRAKRLGESGLIWQAVVLGRSSKTLPMALTVLTFVANFGRRSGDLLKVN